MIFAKVSHFRAILQQPSVV